MQKRHSYIGGTLLLYRNGRKAKTPGIIFVQCKGCKRFLKVIRLTKVSCNTLDTLSHVNTIHAKVPREYP